MIEIFNSLAEIDKNVVTCYFISGGIFILISYVIYNLKKINSPVRVSISAFVLSVGFMLLSAAGKIINGYPESYTYITFWIVILSTIIAFWVAVEMYRWNQRKIEIEKS